jgi:hypothetical protein
MWAKGFLVPTLSTKSPTPTLFCFFSFSPSGWVVTHVKQDSGSYWISVSYLKASDRNELRQAAGRIKVEGNPNRGTSK